MRKYSLYVLIVFVHISDSNCITEIFRDSFWAHNWGGDKEIGTNCFELKIQKKNFEKLFQKILCFHFLLYDFIFS